MSDSITWRRFCRIPLDGKVPHPTTLKKLATRCGTAAVDGLNEALLAKAAQGKLLRTSWLRGHHGCAGLAFCVFTAARFDLRELVYGHGDQWVAGGALAISTLAAARVTEAGGALGQFSEQHSALATGALVLWCLAMAWLLPLATAEVLRPRLGYDARRWATVFPLGMYAACSFATGQVTGITGITGSGQVWTWVALTASLPALAGLLRRGWPVLRSQHTGPAARDAR